MDYLACWLCLGVKNEMLNNKFELFSASTVIIVHIVALVVLMSYSKQNEQTLRQISPISVSFVVSVQTKQEKITPPKKQEQVVRQVKKQDVPVASKLSTSNDTVMLIPVIKQVEEKRFSSAETGVTSFVKKQIEEKVIEQSIIVPPNFNANYLQNPQPKYPLSSRKLGEEGVVVLRVFVEIDGTAKKVEIKTSCGFVRLDQSAMEAVREWKFVPAKKGEEHISTWVNVPIVFKMGA